MLGSPRMRLRQSALNSHASWKANLSEVIRGVVASWSTRF